MSFNKSIPLKSVPLYWNFILVLFAVIKYSIFYNNAKMSLLAPAPLPVLPEVDEDELDVSEDEADPDAKAARSPLEILHTKINWEQKIEISVQRMLCLSICKQHCSLMRDAWELPWENLLFIIDQGMATSSLTKVQGTLGNLRAWTTARTGWAWWWCCWTRRASCWWRVSWIWRTCKAIRLSFSIDRKLCDVRLTASDIHEICVRRSSYHGDFWQMAICCGNVISMFREALSIQQS